MNNCLLKKAQDAVERGVDFEMLHKLRSVKAREATGWLIDYAGSMDDALQMTWKIAAEGDAVLSRRKLAEDRLKAIPSEVSGLTESDNPATTAARKAIFACIQKSCDATLSEALTIQAKHLVLPVNF